MFFKRYERSELIVDAVFENTLSASSKNSNQLQADHSKLDQVRRRWKRLACRHAP